MRPRPQVGHGAEIFLLCWGKPIEANSEKALIESRNRFVRCVRYIVRRDGTLGRNIPSMFSPLLQKVRITLCLRNDEVDGFIKYLNPFVFRRFDNCFLGIGCGQWADLGEVEKTLGVRLGLS